jgi:lipopolysaccharide biosynthesis glycosyltransferase
MNNIIFCFDIKYEKYLKNILLTFKKYHNFDMYKFHFILTCNEDEYNILLKKINDTIITIDKKINYNCYLFKPPIELVESISRYNKLLFDNDKNEETIFINYANWSRFYITDLIPNIKIGLYLDMDILFLGNIDEIFKISFSNYPLCVFNKIDKSIYFLTYREYSKNNVDNITTFKEFHEINPNKSKKHYERFINRINENKIIFDELNININDLKNNNAYNCGVLLFNFKMIEQMKIREKILKLINLMCDKNNSLFRTGTEKTMNILIPNNKTISDKYNFIKNKKEKIDYDKIKIIHFKGKKNLETNKLYLDITNKINE